MQVAESVRERPRYLVLDRLLEVSILAAVALVPLTVAHDSVMVGFVQVAKMGVFRTLVVLVVIAASMRWALEWRAASPSLDDQISRLRSHPARLIIFGAAAVLAANLIALAFSPVKAVGIWGVDPGWDTYGLVNIAAYLVLFGVVAAHVRTRAQVQRFLWAVVASAVLVSLYGISQHFGVDLMRTGVGPVRRASLSFGNPIFAGSFLVLTIPLTMALVMSLKDKTDRAEHILLGATLIAPQIAAMAFTLSRGPWVGLIAGMGALVVLLYWMGGLAVARRGLVILASAGAIAFLLVLLPVPGAASGSGVGDVGERLGGIPAGVAGGMTHRWTTWTTAAEAFVTVPWVDTAEYPEFPELGFRPLRPLVGYGPDMFGYAYPLAGEQTYTFEISTHGHNFLVHTALELGLLGVAAYVFLAVAIGLALLRLLRAARVRNGDLLYLMLLVGLGAAFVGRVVEQIPGKAQVSDLMLAWVLAGLVVALTTFHPSETEDGVPESASNASVRRAGRRARNARRPAAGPVGPLSVPRILGAGLMSVLLVAVWVLHVGAPVSAAFATAEAARLGQAGQSQRMVDTYQEAVGRYEIFTTSRYRAAQTLNQISQSIEDPEQQVGVIRLANQYMESILARNPMDYRAMSRHAEYSRDLAQRGAISEEEAIRPALMQVQLMPGFWQSYAILSLTYLTLGETEEALAAATQAQELDNGTGEVYLAYYLGASALAEMGRIEEALAALDESLERRETDSAKELQEQLLAAVSAG